MWVGQMNPTVPVWWFQLLSPVNVGQLVPLVTDIQASDISWPTQFTIITQAVAIRELPLSSHGIFLGLLLLPKIHSRQMWFASDIKWALIQQQRRGSVTVRVCHYSNQWKEAAFKQTFVFPHIPKYKWLCCPPGRNWFMWPQTLQMTSLIKVGSLLPRRREKFLLWKDYSAAWKTAFELQNPRGPRVSFSSVCFQDTCFNMSRTHGGEGGYSCGAKRGSMRIWKGVGLWGVGGGGCLSCPSFSRA